MKLWHGSPISGITTLTPHAAEHGDAVFLTDSETLAAIYAHTNHVWYTYTFLEGKLVYDEVFPDQLRRLYEGQPGYVYEVDGEAKQHEKMPWVYMAGAVDVAGCRYIPDLYEHLLSEEKAGRLAVRRHAYMPEKTLASYRRMTVEGLIRNGQMIDPGCEYAQFVQTWMPEWWQEALAACKNGPDAV